MAKSSRPKTDSLPTCMNCGAVLYGAYCSRCGQRVAATLSFRGTLAEGWRRLRELDFAWLRTASALSTDPGRMVRGYLRGRRRPYVPPLLYALGTSSVLAATALLALDPTRLSSLTPWAVGTARPLVIAVGIYGGLVVGFGVACLQRFLHRDAGHNLLETWVFGLFVFGHLALFQCLFVVLGAFATPIGLAALAAAVLLVLTFALAGFYRQAVLRALPAALILSASYIAGVFVLSSLARLAWG